MSNILGVIPLLLRGPGYGGTLFSGLAYLSNVPQGSTIFPITKDLTITQDWTILGDLYNGLNNSVKASVRVDATINNTDTGILMEAGDTGAGLVLYVFGGKLYFQAGNGSAFGSAASRSETEYTLPVGEFNYVIEWFAEATNFAALCVNGVVVDRQTFDTSKICGSDKGTFGTVAVAVAANRGGWGGSSAGRVFTNTITRCNIFENQLPLLQRNLTRLTAGVQQYFKVPTRTATGDFELECDVFSSGDTTAKMVLGKSDSIRNCVFMQNDDIVVRDNAGVSTNSAGDKFPRDVFSTLNIKKEGNNVAVKRNGITVATGISSASFTFNMIGMRQSSSFPFSGYLSNVHFKSGFDDNPWYPIDETWANGSTVLHNANAVLGSDITNIDALNTTAIGEPLTSTYTVVSTGQLVVGNQYVIHATVSNYQGSSTLGFLNDNGVSAAAISQDGTISKVFTATGTGTLRLFNRSSNSCSFSNIKVYEEQGAGTAVNIDKDDGQPFTRNNSVSPNVLVNDDGSVTLPIAGT